MEASPLTLEHSLSVSYAVKFCLPLQLHDPSKRLDTTSGRQLLRIQFIHRCWPQRNSGHPSRRRTSGEHDHHLVETLLSPIADEADRVRAVLEADHSCSSARDFIPPGSSRRLKRKRKGAAPIKEDW